MKRKFAVFDIDGTLIRWQLYHAVVDELSSRGRVDVVGYQSVTTLREAWQTRQTEDSFNAYEQKLVNLFDQALYGITAEELTTACQVVINEYKDQVYTFTRDLMKDLKSKNYLLFAISASQDQVVGMLANYYQFDDYGGSTYGLQDGSYTGQKSILKSQRKAEYLTDLVKKHNATFDSSIAVGDSEGDIAMLEKVEQPIAFNPTKKLYQHAMNQGWKIVVERKNVVYKLEMQSGSYQLA